MNILIVGLGTITENIIRYIKRNPSSRVTVYSRHAPYKDEYDNIVISNSLSVCTTYKPDFIISCVEDDSRSISVWEELSSTIDLNSVTCIEMSTLSHKYVLYWHDYIDAAGGIAVEAPFTGSKLGAEEGNLSVFLYYPPEHSEVVKIFELFSSNIYNFTNKGIPTLFKLIYNAWGAFELYGLGIFINILSDFMSDDFKNAQEIILKDGWMASVASSKLDNIINDDFSNPHFKAKYMYKDLKYFFNSVEQFDSVLDYIFQEYKKYEDSYSDFSIIAKLNK